MLGIPTSFKNYQQQFQNRLEIDLGICKGLRSYEFYRQFAAQSSNMHVNNQYFITLNGRRVAKGRVEGSTPPPARLK